MDSSCVKCTLIQDEPKNIFFEHIPVWDVLRGSNVRERFLKQESDDMATTPSHTDWVQATMNQYEQPLLRYALRLTGEIETARDVVQDTFLKLCITERGQIENHLVPWLYRVCRNRALDVMKKEHRMQPIDDSTLEAYPSSAPLPSTLAEKHETETRVLTTLAALPDNQQEVFRLKFLDQLTYKEISAVTGYPVNHVRYLIHISLQRMREKLQDLLTADAGTYKEIH